jgi:hypothetical protein
VFASCATNSSSCGKCEFSLELEEASLEGPGVGRKLATEVALAAGFGVALADMDDVVVAPMADGALGVLGKTEAKDSVAPILKRSTKVLVSPDALLAAIGMAALLGNALAASCDSRIADAAVQVTSLPCVLADAWMLSRADLSKIALAATLDLVLVLRTTRVSLAGMSVQNA